MNEVELGEFRSPKPHFVTGKDFETRPKLLHILSTGLAFLFFTPWQEFRGSR